MILRESRSRLRFHQRRESSFASGLSTRAPPARVELAANALGSPDRDPTIDGEAENKADREDRISPESAPRTPAVHSRSIPGPSGDPLEHALLLAAEAGRFDVVAQLGRELEARRFAGGNVVAIDSTRRRNR